MGADSDRGDNVGRKMAGITAIDDEDRSAIWEAICRERDNLATTPRPWKATEFIGVVIDRVMSMRLVASGVHAFGWSREDVLITWLAMEIKTNKALSTALQEKIELIEGSAADVPQA